MITFESIRWKNFLSTGDQWTEISLCESKATLIVGSNGAGKSTLLDALTFALFGKPFRRINKGQLVNSINEKGTKVEVNFSIGKDDYRVFRTIKPNGFEVYKNNKMVDQDAAVKDTQKHLEQSILKLNYKSFTQVVILGSSTFVPFMQLTVPHRREVIEDLLDIKIFSNMNLLLKERVREAQVKSKDCIYLLSMAEERVNSQENLIKSLREINTTRRKEKEDKVILNKAKISTTQSSISDKEVELKEIESKISGTEDKASHLQELRQRGSDINSELKRVSKDMKFLKSHDDCPTCHQSIDKDFKETKISSLTESGVKLSKAYKKEQKAIEKVVSLIEQADALSMKAHELRSDISSFERDLVRLDSDNLQIEKELSELTSTPKIEKELKTLNVYTEELEQTKIDCGQVSKTIDEFTVVSLSLIHI